MKTLTGAAVDTVARAAITATRVTVRLARAIFALTVSEMITHEKTSAFYLLFAFKQRGLAICDVSQVSGKLQYQQIEYGLNLIQPKHAIMPQMLWTKRWGIKASELKP
jgi:hypothetical protein